MQTRRMLFAYAASAALLTFAPAVAAPQHGKRDKHDNRDQHGDRNQQDNRGQHGNQGWQGSHRDWRDDRGNWHRDHDRYWRSEYRNRRFVGRDHIFMELRRRHYTRFVGDPYWFQGRYVVRAYDRFGRVVFVEVNPYTGAFIGVIRF